MSEKDGIVMTDDMLEAVVKYSNKKLSKMRQEYRDPDKSDLHDWLN